MNLQRSESRSPSDLRSIKFETGYYDYAEGSCLVSFGRTKVLCAATIEDQAPPHLRGKGQGWVTGEYNMLPRSSSERIRRERDKVGGRTQEIQRLIGRSLRSIVNLKGWGERSVVLDCDVIQADGGTRTASISGAFVALVLAFKQLKKTGKIPAETPFPVRSYLSAISVGVVQSIPVLDLDYAEDSTAETDMNIVMTSDGKFVELQGTAEKDPFDSDVLAMMLKLGSDGCKKICELQKKAAGDLSW